jgi:hypothetical protein
MPVSDKERALLDALQQGTERVIPILPFLSSQTASGGFHHGRQNPQRLRALQAELGRSAPEQAAHGLPLLSVIGLIILTILFIIQPLLDETQEVSVRHHRRRGPLHRYGGGAGSLSDEEK